MIQVDSRVGSGRDKKGEELLQPIIRRMGVPCETVTLAYGDAAFEGNGPDGPVTLGVERKTVHEMLDRVEDAHYTAQQLVGMKKLYSRSFLIIEGMWERGTPGSQLDGLLIEGFNHGSSWGPLKPYGHGGRTPLYSKLYRYLISVSMSGVIITYSNSLTQTACQIVEIQQYFQKKWREHTALRECQKLAIPSLSDRPSLCKRWANELTDVGVVHGEEAERLFKTARNLANADESEWLTIPGIGVKTARQIVREINGVGGW
jgi:ERCC4-type nuclease